MVYDRLPVVYFAQHVHEMPVQFDGQQAAVRRQGVELGGEGVMSCAERDYPRRGLWPLRPYGVIWPVWPWINDRTTNTED